MKITLLGYGKMGHEIEKIALARNHSISGKITRNSTRQERALALKNADCIIEFTQPDSAISNMKECLELGKPVVTGTTGWYDELDGLVNYCKECEGSVFYASNFSVGVNVLFHINKVLAKIMNQLEGYSPKLTEIHHVHKKDSPSGTAITLANGLLENIDRLSTWKEVSNNTEIPLNTLPIKALREDEVPGTHFVGYDSDIDYLEIKHIAKNRKGFALGSVLAAEWLLNKKGVFTMTDMLDFN